MSKPYSLCIVGNSHLVALKNAWTDRRPETARDISLTFFAGPTNLMGRLEIEQRSLVAPGSLLRDLLERYSGGKNTIDIDDFDAFAVVGGGFGVSIPHLCGAISIAEQYHLDPAMPVVSHNCFREYARALLRRSSAYHITKLLRTIFAGPLVIHAEPFRPQRLIDTPEMLNNARMRDIRSLDIIVRLTLDVASQLCAAKNAHFLRQDDDTVGLPGYTREAFWKTPSERDTQLGVVDMWHMNEEYGLRSLNAILSKLEEILQTTAPASPSTVGDTV